MAWRVLVPKIPTRQFLSVEDLNRIDMGGYAKAVSLYSGVDAFGGQDMSYQTSEGYRSKKFRGQFDLWHLAFDIPELADNFCKLGNLDAPRNSFPRKVYYFYGCRIVVEYFDENAIVDFTNTMEEDASIQGAIESFRRVLDGRFKVTQLNEYLVNVESL